MIWPYLKSIEKLNYIKEEEFKLDSIVYDMKSKSFVIIEYKRNKSLSVVDQGYDYLALMLNNKADFILEYNGNTEHILNKDDVDWSQSRVIFISPSFTTNQIEAINFNDLPIQFIKNSSNIVDL